MLWWRKRNEGFEWRDYVRTTILVRREQRRQRIKDVQAAAAAHVKDAGKRGLEVGVAGTRAAGTGLWSGAKQALAVAGAVIARLGAHAAKGVTAAGTWLADTVPSLTQRLGGPIAPLLAPLTTRVREPKIQLALAVVAAAAGLGALYRTYAFGFDTDALVAAVLAVIAAALLVLGLLAGATWSGNGSREGRENLLHRLRRSEFELPLSGAPRLSASTAGLAVLGLIGVAGIATLMTRPPASTNVASARSPALKTSALQDRDPSRLEGRAIALTGDSLRISGTVVLLDGIEAPEVSQSCRRNGSAWRCGAAAREALATLVRGRRITCAVVDEDDAGKHARCEARGADIAGQMVRNGHVFSNGGFLSAYAGFESDAQSEKRGLWSGEADRPQDYRDKRWEEAKKSAPDGCPIKGRIQSGARTYVLPWAATYESVRLRTSRGERWFCSESEAQAAGWSRS